MIREKPTMAFGWRVYGLGVMALGATTLAFRDFNPGQSVPAGFPARTALAFAVGVFLLVAGAAIEWGRTTAWASAAITIYYGLFVVILMNGRLLLTSYASYGIYEEISMQLAITLAGLIVFATTSDVIDAALAARLVRGAQLAFGVCALVWGGAHFVYMNFTAPLVPKWLPPSQVFWGYATGICFIAAGLALLTGVRARLAAILLTVMIAGFLVLANGLTLLAQPNHYNWTECALSLALVGAAWVVADSLSPKRLPD
jgi:uncharacterized membrane protein YphA (DoxX/SURF4 family)